MATLAAILFMLVFCLGLWLLACGLRGRIINDHPICARCRFDLVGLHPAPAGAEPGKCPECGQDLAGGAGVIIGARRRSRGKVWCGAAVVAACAALLVTVAAVMLSNYNYHRIMPTWGLVTCLEIEGPSGRTRALAELQTRLTAGTLSQAEIDSVINRAIAAARNTSAAWLPAWGDFVEAARAGNRVSDAQFGAYLRAALQLTVTARARIAEGDPWAVEIACELARGGTGSGPPEVINLRDGVLVIDGREIKTSTSAAFGLGGRGASSTRSGVALDLPAGTYKAVGRWQASITSPGAGQPLAAWVEEAPLTVEVLPRGTPIITVVDDATLMATMDRAVIMGRGGITAQTMQEGPGEQRRTSINLTIDAVNVPMDVAFSITLREAGAPGMPPPPSPRSWPLASRISFRSNGASSYAVGDEIAGFDAPYVDVILSPSVPAALETVDITRIWSGQIVIRNVPVGGSARP